MDSFKESAMRLFSNHEFRWSLFASLLYGFCSGSMNFLNKAVLSMWEFNHPSMIILSQIVMLSLGLHLLKLLGKVHLETYTFKSGSSLYFLSFIYCLNATVALSALSDMNIPMYNAMRRCVPIGSLVLGCLIFNKQKPNRRIVLSVVVITVGTFVAAAGDLEFHLKGYVFGICSVALQSVYLVLLQKAERDLKIGALSIAYINAVNSLPVLALIILLTGDVSSIIQYPHWTNFSFQIWYWVLVCYGCIFTYSMFLCTTINSALTTALVGVLKSAITTIVGMYTFGGVPVTAMLTIGQLVNLFGGVMYSYEKYKIAVHKSKSPPLLTHDLKSESDLLRLTDVKVNDSEKHNSAE